MPSIAKQGSGADQAGPDETYEGFVYLDHDKHIVRYVAALREKRKQCLEFLERGTVAADDAVVVAINGSPNSVADIDPGIPDILRAVFPIDKPKWLVLIDAQRWQEPPDVIRTSEATKQQVTVSLQLTHRAHVAKAGGSPVPQDAFLTDDYAHISAVLFTPRGLGHGFIRNLSGDDWIIVHNPKAKSPIAPGLLRIGREWRCDLAAQTISCTDWRTASRDV